MKSIGYSTRLCKDSRVKVCGGSFGGSLDIETVNRLVNAHFQVKVKPSGHAVFVDRQGQEVYLYLSVNPKLTTKGEEAIKQWRAEQALQQKEEDERREREQETIDELLGKLTYEEIVERLTK